MIKQPIEVKFFQESFLVLTFRRFKILKLNLNFDFEVLDKALYCQ